ncbi:MAG: hypothetical protein ABIF77_18850 [bacterium]
MPAKEVRGTILPYIIIWPLLLAIPGLILGALLGLMTGIKSEFMLPLGMLATTVFAWWFAMDGRAFTSLGQTHPCMWQCRVHQPWHHGQEPES